MPTDLFLETTGLIDLYLRSAEARQHVFTQLGAEPALHSSRYAQFELARGFLRHLLTLYNKANDLDSMADLMVYVKNRGIGGQYAGPSMLGAYTDYIRHLETQGAALTETQRLLHFRAWLATFIRRGWQRMAREVTMSNPVGCRDDIAEPAAKSLPFAGRPREHLEQPLPTKACGSVGNCGLMTALRSSGDSFQTLHGCLCGQTKPDPETVRRADAMSRLLSHDPATAFAGKDCHACGDAIMVFEARQSHTFVTKNAKHQVPLCQSLGKTVIAYTEATTRLPS